MQAMIGASMRLFTGPPIVVRVLLNHGAAVVKSMGPGVKHTSASARVQGDSLQGDTPVFAQVHLFFRPDHSYMALWTIGGGFSRPWKDE